VKPRQGGSGGPRAILAYYYAMAHIAAEFSSAYLPPLVIDSPHANAQDDINRPKVTEFIFRNKVDGQQLIVGLEDPPPKTVLLKAPDDTRHDLKIKYGLLQKSEYKYVLEFVEPLMRQAVASLGKTLF
jgi:3-deoxy-D-arabino-heptulosonate 7-phosphate (DAHP) synthase